MAVISNETLDVLAECQVEGTTLYLPGRQLDRRLYESVNKVLTSLGGKWDRRAKGHLFSADPTEALEAVVLTGTYDRPEDLGWFETPEDIARMVIETARIERGMSVLEPSAGRGALARPARAAAGGLVECVEVHPGRAADLLTQGFPTVCGDFLDEPITGRFDRVIMNPPFARQQDIDHVDRALRHLKPGGRLVAIMSAGVMFRTNRKTEEFRDFIRLMGGTFLNLPDGAFKPSGTAVRTVMLTIQSRGGAA